MKNFISGISNKFKKDIRGNVSMMFAASALPLILVVGAAIDYAKYTNDIQRAQVLADATVLAHASATLERGGDWMSDDFWESLFESVHIARANRSNKFSENENIKWQPTEEDGVFNARILYTGETKHSFLGLVGNPSTPWEVVAEVRVDTRPKMDIVLVLDISHSMFNNDRIEPMQAAVTNFINDIDPFFNSGNDFISVSVIPFAQSVNFGPESEVWLDDDPDVAFEFSDQFHGCFRDENGEAVPGSYQAHPQRQNVVGNPNAPVCQSDSSAARLFSFDRSGLINHIRDLSNGWGTNTNLAMTWANRLFQQEWRDRITFAESTPNDISRVRDKVVVLLTDGGIVDVDPDETGYLIRARDSRALYSDQELAEFDQICNEFETIENLDLYTIAFDFDPNEFGQALQNCTVGEGQFFKAGINDLSGVFEVIRDKTTAVRLTR